MSRRERPQCSPLINWEPDGNKNRRPTIAALTILIAGFGALNVFYFYLHSVSPKPGLYDYLASSIGDGILLPFAAFAAERATQGSRGYRRASLCGGIIGFTLGMTTQAVWLLDPSPGLNWTLVMPGHFNSAGWYHAVFLIATMTYFGTRTAKLIWIILLKDRQGPAWATICYFCAVAAFGAILFIDNRTSNPDHFTSWSTNVIILSTAVLAAIIFATLAVKERSSKRESPTEKTRAQ